MILKSEDNIASYELDLKKMKIKQLKNELLYMEDEIDAAGYRAQEKPKNKFDDETVKHRQCKSWQTRMTKYKRLINNVLKEKRKK